MGSLKITAFPKQSALAVCLTQDLNPDLKDWNPTKLLTRPFRTSSQYWCSCSLNCVHPLFPKLWTPRVLVALKQAKPSPSHADLLWISGSFFMLWCGTGLNPHIIVWFISIKCIHGLLNKNSNENSISKSVISQADKSNAEWYYNYPGCVFSTWTLE